MQRRPFDNQTQSTARQLTLNDLECADIDCSFEFTIPGMEVWWCVVIEKLPDQDPIKVADRRHCVARMLALSGNHLAQPATF